jgi:hypothetical protein
MRRILTGILLLILAPSITEAWCGNSYTYCQVHYSPYAFGYGKTGLVPGGIVYSPYAFGISSSGLVFEGVRYEPYAFGYGKTGLVLDYCACALPYVVYNAPCSTDQSGRLDHGCAACAPMPSCQSAPAPRASIYATAEAPAKDMLYVIRQHLRDRGYKDVGVNCIMRVDNQLVSVDFTLASQNLLIKYWDPEQVDQMRTKPDSTQKAFQRYKDNWESFAARHEQSGGKIVHVSGSDPQEVVAVLDACLPSTPGSSPQTPQTMYAKK